MDHLEIYSDLAKILLLAENASRTLPGSLDLVTARTEFYTHPSALPTVERSSIKLDLHRRDFTINAMALRLDGTHWGELYDYWGGLNDLRRGLVRVLHSLSFVDDPTRICAPCASNGGFLSASRRTLELLKEAATLLDRVSGDRIRHEINYILVEERSADAEPFKRTGLLKAIHSDLVWDRWLREEDRRAACKQWEQSVRFLGAGRCASFVLKPAGISFMSCGCCAFTRQSSQCGGPFEAADGSDQDGPGSHRPVA